MNIEDIEAQLKSLLKGKYSSLTISFNDDHAPNYAMAEDWEEYYGDNRDWISNEDRNLAVSTNSVWCLHWYPDTPIGFCRIYASSLS